MSDLIKAILKAKEALDNSPRREEIPYYSNLIANVQYLIAENQRLKAGEGFVECILFRNEIHGVPGELEWKDIVSIAESTKKEIEGE